MAINLSDLQDVDIADLATWPQWFKTFAVVLVFGGLLYGGYHFIISDQLVELDKLERQEKDLKQTYLDRKAKAINLPVYREQMEQMQSSFEVMVGQLPDKTEVPQLLNDITQAGLSRGLTFSVFQPRPEGRGDFYATLPINLRVSGSYHQFGQFVSDLAALPRIVTVGNIQLSAQANGNLNVSALVKTFRYLDEEDVGANPTGKKTRTVRK
jgi:type IV pilus assembly protein PilO